MPAYAEGVSCQKSAPLRFLLKSQTIVRRRKHALGIPIPFPFLLSARSLPSNVLLSLSSRSACKFRKHHAYMPSQRSTLPKGYSVLLALFPSVSKSKKKRKGLKHRATTSEKDAQTWLHKYIK